MRYIVETTYSSGRVEKYHAQSQRDAERHERMVKAIPTVASAVIRKVRR